MSFSKSLTQTVKVSAKDLLLRYPKHAETVQTLSLPELATLNEQVVLWINGGHFKPDQQAKVLKNLTLYLKALQKNKQHEALAHFASMLEQDNYTTAATLILVETADIMPLLEQFIVNLNLE